MKIITGNRLNDGAVVYLDADGQWTADIAVAAKFEKADADQALDAAKGRTREMADVYLVDVDEAGALAGRERLRETIRKLGPTVREDLGYQAVS